VELHPRPSRPVYACVTVMLSLLLYHHGCAHVRTNALCNVTALKLK